MRTIIDYNLVLERLQARGLVCNYYNSGAFGFPRETSTQTIAWAGPPDDTIRPAVRPLVRFVPEPYAPNLAALATRFWQQHLRVPVWVMPMSHWAFELDFGSADWLPGLLQAVGISPANLQHRNNASAIEFLPDDQPPFRLFLQGLLSHLTGSDFLLAFPDQPIICMVHHHKQLWWTTTNPDWVAPMEQLPASL